MSSTADLLVLGGGIAGLTTAVAAADRGLTAIILDTPRAGSASRAAAGMLAPSVEGLPEAMLSAAIAARDFYPDYLGRLREQTKIQVALDRGGILQIGAADEPGQLRASAPRSAQWMDEAALAGMEPAYAHHAGALFHPLDGVVDNLALMDVLDRVVEQTPGIQRVTAEVLSVDASEPSVLTRTRGRFHGAHVLLASGAWAGSMRGLPRDVPVRPVRGQLLRLNAAPIRHVTYGLGGYLVPKGDAVLVGATSEEAGFESETSLAGLAALRSIAARAIPALSSALVVDHWAGLRPMSLDGHPILGTDPDAPALVYACGYSRNGILFAPWAAAQLASLLVGDSDGALTPFSIGRPALQPVR